MNNPTERAVTTALLCIIVFLLLPPETKAQVRDLADVILVAAGWSLAAAFVLLLVCAEWKAAANAVDADKERQARKKRRDLQLELIRQHYGIKEQPRIGVYFYKVGYAIGARIRRGQR